MQRHGGGHAHEELYILNTCRTIRFLLFLHTFGIIQKLIYLRQKISSTILLATFMVNEVIIYIFKKSHHNTKNTYTVRYWRQCILLEFHCRPETIKEHTKEQA